MHRRNMILGGLICLLLASVGSAGDKESQIHWRKDMKVAYKESQATGKPMFVQFTAGWCGYCKKMEQSTFSDPQVIEFINQTFIPLMIDKERNEKFAQAVGIEGLPTTVVISPQLEMTEKLTGFQSSWELTKALSSYQRAQLNSAALAKNAAETREYDPFVRTADVPPNTSAAPLNELPAKNAIAPSGYDEVNRDADFFPADPSDETDEWDATEASEEFAAEDELFPSREPAESESAAPPSFSQPVPQRRPREPIAPIAQQQVEQEVRGGEATLPPLAFNGDCLVSALDDRQLVEGLPEFGVVYSGRMVFFASHAHREAFIANPKAYWPANDGYCAVAAEAGKVKPGQLKHATVYHNRLWLFADDESRDRFMEHPREYSRAAPDQSSERDLK
ncbi:MAG: thioredoxin family protein [Planctomycetaceae bacterium]